MKANKIKEVYQIEDYRSDIQIEIGYTVENSINQINIHSRNVPDITMLLDEYKALKYILEDVLDLDLEEEDD